MILTKQKERLKWKKQKKILALSAAARNFAPVAALATTVLEAAGAENAMVAIQID